MIDVLIVGGGPAGTAAAWDLLEKGYQVLILDKYEFPRKKACAGGITPKGYRLYQYDITSMIKRTCHGLAITTPSKTRFDIKSDSPLCYMTDRTALDHFCLQTVIRKGAGFEKISKITRISQDKNTVVLKAGDKSFRARFLIGADGSNSKIRQLIAKKNILMKRPALEADIRVDDPGRFSMTFDFSGIQKGYFWIFPKENHINVGLYSYDQQIKPKLSDLESCTRSVIGKTELANIKGYPIHTGGSGILPGKDRVLLAGDAAGFAEPLFGEGIYFALRTGQLAAGAISDPDIKPRVVIQRYARLLKPVLGDLKLYGLSAAIFYRFPGLSLKIAAMKPIHNHFAKGFSRGEPLKNMFFKRY